MKRFFKQSKFLIALVRAFRIGLREFQAIFWILGRQKKIRKYLQNNSAGKLQIGTDTNYLPGWLNTDLFPNRKDVMYLDATRKFPFPDQSFDYIFAEHLIEHLTFEQGRQMLKECFRVLKVQGKIRIVTPDLEVLAKLASSTLDPNQKHYLDWNMSRYFPEEKNHLPALVINNSFRSWGHKFIYDYGALKNSLEAAGFSQVQRFLSQQSNDPVLQGIEIHGKVRGDEEINRFEVMAVEARRT